MTDSEWQSGTVRGAGSSKAWMALAGILFCVVVGVAVMWWRGGEPDPSSTALRFLTTSDCSTLRSLADEHGREELRGQACRNLTDAAQGMRTYTDPDLRTSQRSRLVRAGDPRIDGDRAEVVVSVAYGTDNASTPEEKVSVVLVHRGDRWLVQSWGVVG